MVAGVWVFHLTGLWDAQESHSTERRPEHPTKTCRKPCVACFVAARKTLTIPKVKLINFKMFRRMFLTATLTVFWWQANENKSWTYNKSINKRADTTYSHTHTLVHWSVFCSIWEMSEFISLDNIATPAKYPNALISNYYGTSTNFAGPNV